MRSRPALAVVMALVFAGCGAGAGNPPIDAKKADMLAHDLLIDPRVLPGSGWSLRAVDAADPAPATAGGEASEQCSQRANELAAADARLASGRLGRANVELERTRETSPVPLDISLTIEVYRDPGGLDDWLTATRESVEGSSYLSCLEDSFRSASSPNVGVQARRVRPLAPVPNNGVAAAAELTASLETDASQSVDYRVEGYRWLFGRILVLLDITGQRDSFTAEIVNAAVTATEGRLEVEAR